MPSSRQASRIVAPSGTRDRLRRRRQLDHPRRRAAARVTRAPSRGRVELRDRRLDRARARSGRDRRSTRRACTGRPRRSAQLGSTPPSGWPRAGAQRLLLADRADPAGHALPARLVAEEGGDPQEEPGMSTVSSKTMTTPEPSVAPTARVPSKVSGTSSSSGADEAPAAPPSRTACSGRPPGPRPPARAARAASSPNGTSYTPGRSTAPETQNSFVPVEPSVPIAANAAPRRGRCPGR